jgi:hypothetical protein
MVQSNQSSNCSVIIYYLKPLALEMDFGCFDFPIVSMSVAQFSNQEQNQEHSGLWSEPEFNV